MKEVKGVVEEVRGAEGGEVKEARGVKGVRDAEGGKVKEVRGGACELDPWRVVEVIGGESW